jgi:hypothetical protein
LVEREAKALRTFSAGNRPGQRPGYLEDDESSTGLSLSLTPAERHVNEVVQEIFEGRSGGW